MPPMRICPSAPMFQKRILNAGARPTAMQSSITISRMVTQMRLLVPKRAFEHRGVNLQRVELCQRVDDDRADDERQRQADQSNPQRFPERHTPSRLDMRIKRFVMDNLFFYSWSFPPSFKYVIRYPTSSFVVVRASTMSLTCPAQRTMIRSQSSSSTSRSSPTKMTAGSAFFLFAQQMIDIIRGVDIEPAHRIGGHEKLRLHGDLASDEHLLHVSAGEPAHRRVDAGCDDLQIAHDGLRELLRVFAVCDRPFSVPIAAQHHIVRQVHAADEPHAEAVFRHERERDAEILDLERMHAGELFLLPFVGDKLNLAAIAAGSATPQWLRGALFVRCRRYRRRRGSLRCRR